MSIRNFMRTKVKTPEEIIDFLNTADFEPNQHKNVHDHLLRNECPYCGCPLMVNSGHLDSLKNDDHLLVKRLCSLSKNKNSFNVKNAVHLIYKTPLEEVKFRQSHGHSENQFVYDEE